MANAAAKKAAVAEKEAKKIYLPLLGVTNLIYIALLLGGETKTITATKFGIFATLVTWAEQAYAYFGILDHAASNAGNSSKKRNSKDLTGGSSLDLLAVTLAVQFGSVLHSTKWLWISVVGVPIVGAYSLYKAVYGGESKNPSNYKSAGAKEDEDPDDPVVAKRRRRAEKRRQKWG